MNFDSLSSFKRIAEIQDFYCMSVKEIDPIFKIFKTYSTNLQDLSARLCSTTFKIFDFQDSEIYENQDFENDSGSFLNYWGQFGWAKVENNWFWGSWTRPLGPKIMIMMTFLFFPK